MSRQALLMCRQSLQTLRWSQRGVAPHRQITSYTVIHPGEVQMDEATRDKAAPRVGNRDIVGYGQNGSASYHDCRIMPCPAIRFGENTPEFLKLREKEKGDWKNLTIEEKKGLYRGNFCQTYSEIRTSRHTPMSAIIQILWGFVISSVGIIVMRQFTNLYPLPMTATLEWQEAMLARMLEQHQGKIDGVSSYYDYEKQRWKD